jgi:hypothetical protein
MTAINDVELWAEGVAGKFHLEVDYVAIGSPTVAPISTVGNAAAPTAAASKLLADFAGKATLTWSDSNDPVMGGQSFSSFSTGSDPKFGTVGVFDGENKIVPSLAAPGFCKAIGQFPKSVDLAGFAYGGSVPTAIKMVVRSRTPTYQGFKFGFRGKGIPKTSIFGGGSFKAGFSMNGTDPSLFQEVTIPMAKFSYDWSGFTGDCNTKDPARGLNQQHYCCSGSGESPSKDSVCPSAKYLKDISDVEIWAEGVAGIFNIEVVSVSVVSEPTVPEH